MRKIEKVYAWVAVKDGRERVLMGPKALGSMPLMSDDKQHMLAGAAYMKDIAREGNINIKLLCFDNVSVLEEINPDE